MRNEFCISGSEGKAIRFTKSELVSTPSTFMASFVVRAFLNFKFLGSEASDRQECQGQGLAADMSREDMTRFEILQIVR